MQNKNCCCSSRKKCCISFGKCYLKYALLILFVLILEIASFFILFFFNKYFIKNDIKFIEKINTISYAFFVSLGESFMIIPHLILKKNISSKISLPINESTSNNLIKYIFNNTSFHFSLKEKIFFIIVGLLKLVLEIMYISYQLYIEKYFDIFSALTHSFQFELFFLFLLAKLIYKIPFYRHHYLSITFLTLFSFFRFLITYFDTGVGNFFLYFFINSLYSFLQSLLTVYIKGLMEFKYLSPYKSCYFFGFINLGISTIIYFIISFFPCDKEKNEFCAVEYNGQYYYDNMLVIFSVFGVAMFIFVIIKAIILLINYFIIYNYSVCHSFLLIQLKNMFEIFLFMTISIKFFYSLIIVLTIIFFFNISFILIFLEFIEINRCKLSDNTKKNISIRAVSIDITSVISGENSDTEEGDEEEEIEELN